jgi:hypothetical protein
MEMKTEMAVGGTHLLFPFPIYRSSQVYCYLQSLNYKSSITYGARIVSYFGFQIRKKTPRGSKPDLGH